MKKLMYVVMFSLLSVGMFASPQSEASETGGTTVTEEEVSNSSSYQRVVSAGGTVTEIMYALGLEDLLVAVDISSLYPAEALEALPSVGYVRSLSAENILALDPDLVLTTMDAGPAEVISQLESSGVALRQVAFEDSAESTADAILEISRIFGVIEDGQQLVDSLFADLESVQENIPEGAEKPTVAFIYARGAGTLMVSGFGTSADAIIALAGGQNAVMEYPGYKPLTNEALVESNPDILLFTSSGLQSLGGVDGLIAIPALSELTAVQEGNIYSMDDLLLLGFGPRLGQAVHELAEFFYQ